MTCTSSSATAQATASSISPGMRVSIAFSRSGRARRSRATRGRAASFSMLRVESFGIARTSWPQLRAKQ
jgi:hypothetical protein